MVDPSSKTPKSDVPATVSPRAKPERNEHGNALQVGIGMASLVLKRAAKAAAQAAQAAGGLAQSGATTLAKATRIGATGVGTTAQRVARRTQELVVDFGRSYRAQIGVPEDEDNEAPTAKQAAPVEEKPATRRKPRGSKASGVTAAEAPAAPAKSAAAAAKAQPPRKGAAKPKASTPAAAKTAPRAAKPKAAESVAAEPEIKSETKPEPKAETVREKKVAGAQSPAKAKPARIRKPAAPADGKPGGKPKASTRRKPGTGAATTVH
jgi:hypothetical protein